MLSSDDIIAYQTKFESEVPFMYLDVKGYVTTGIGNKIDSASEAAALPWKRADGSPASPFEIQAEWAHVDSFRTQPKGEYQTGSMALRGGWWFQSVTTLRLDKSDIASLVMRVASEFEDVLRKRFPNYDSFPLDAQLGILSLAWADGPNFHFPAFVAAVNQSPPDFVSAARESHISEVNNPGVHPRNLAQQVLFLNAAAVISQALDGDVLYWPKSLSGGAKGAIGGSLLAVLIVAGFAAWKWLKG